MTPTQPTTPRCTCGRPAATPSEHPQAAKAGKCKVCYEVEQYAIQLQKVAAK
jgi:hypothetical protein